MNRNRNKKSDNCHRTPQTCECYNSSSERHRHECARTDTNHRFLKQWRAEIIVVGTITILLEERWKNRMKKQQNPQEK